MMYNVYYTGNGEGENQLKVRMYVGGRSEEEAYAAFREECINANKWNDTIVVKIEPLVEYK
jgi:hypothetical protein